MALLEYKDKTTGKVKKRKLDTKLVKSIISLVNKGLVSGIGDPAPGQMCVEAAVAYAMGENHNDHPRCVDDALCDFKIEMNDYSSSLYGWDDELDRARGLRRLAVAQLGTNNRRFSYRLFESKLSDRVRAAVRAKFDADGPTLEDISWRVVEAKCLDDLTAVIGELETYKNRFEEAGFEDDAGQSIDPRDIADELFASDLNKALHWVCEQAVQVLVEMKTPGSQYLHLVPLKHKVSEL